MKNPRTIVLLIIMAIIGLLIGLGIHMMDIPYPVFFGGGTWIILSALVLGMSQPEDRPVVLADYPDRWDARDTDVSA